nr:ABC transporter ATP-binding protein [Lachnospiraceae bacterium]
MNNVKRISWKEMWHDVFFQSKNCAAVKYILFFGMLTTAAVPYVNSFVYAHILDNLLASDYKAAVELVFLLVPTVMTVELVSKACSRMYDHYIRP